MLETEYDAKNKHTSKQKKPHRTRLQTVNVWQATHQSTTGFIKCTLLPAQVIPLDTEMDQKYSGKLS